MKFRTDQLISGGICILVGLAMIFSALTFGNFDPRILLICVGIMLILER